MGDSIDYYDILKVSPSATREEIKSSYRDLVRKHHPDSGEESRDASTFQLVQQAWEILGDPEKRKEHDLKDKAPDWESIRNEKLKDFEVKNDKGHDFGTAKPLDPTSSGSWSYPKPKSVRQKKSFSTDDTVFNRGDSFVEKLSQVSKAIINGDSFREKIQGATQVFSRKEIMNDANTGIFGKRSFVVTINALESLSGASREVVVLTPAGKRRIDVSIPKGVNSGANLKIHCPATDVFSPININVKVNVESHSYIERNGLDIILKLPITIGEALSGAEVEVPTIKGTAKVKIPEGWTEGKKLRMKGLGIGSGEVSGDLYIKPMIILPQTESSKKIKLAAKIDELYDGDIRAELPKALK